MNPKFSMVLFCMIMLSAIGIGQTSPMGKFQYKPDRVFDVKIGKQIMQGIDERYGDTIKIYAQKFVVISKDGMVLVDGQILGGMGTECGCSQKANGLWIERFRNGALREQGNYYCNEKIGTWIYGNEAGVVWLIENYKRPYSVELSDHRLDFIFQIGELSLRNNAMLHGSFKEFYPDGVLKKEGQYEIVEVFRTTDSIQIFDPATYEPSYRVEKGAFWKPVSVRKGTWNFYDKTGKLIKTERIQVGNNMAGKWRRIKDRYIELFRQDIGKD